MELKKKGLGTEIMIGLLVTVIIGMIALQISVGTISQKVDQRTVNGVLFTGSNTSCTVIDRVDCIASVTEIRNATGTDTFGSGNYSICNTKSSGGILFTGDVVTKGKVNNVANALNITYVGQDCLQITGMTTTLIRYIPLLMAVLLLVFVAGYIYIK